MSAEIYYSDPELLKSNRNLLAAAKSVDKQIDNAERLLSRVNLDRVMHRLKVEIVPKASSYIESHIIAQYDDSKDFVRLFLGGVMRKSPRIVPRAIVHECGHRYWNKFLTSGKKRLWQDKYIKVSPKAIAVVNAAAQDKTYRSYKEFISQFRDNYTRLVALHLSNALIANKYPIETLDRVDFRFHPATKDFASGSKSFSLTPLISLYAGKDVYEDFAETFRAYVESRGSLDGVRDENGRRMLLYIFLQTIR